MHFKCTFALTNIQTANHLQRLTTEQWQTFFSSSRNWMRFELDGRYGPTSDFIKLSQDQLLKMDRQISLVQQTRSYYEHKMVKTDVWDTRHLFRNEIKRAIAEENHKFDTMVELEEAVVQRIKIWVREADEDMRLEGPWTLQSKLTHPLKRVKTGV